MRLAVCVVGLLGLVGCSVHEDETIHAAHVDELVLQPSDVDPSFRRTYVRNLAGRPRSEVQYRRSHSPRRSEPLTITSRAQVFGSDDAAEESLDTARETLARRRDWQPIDEPGLGDESFAATVLQGGVRYYDVFWREANATALLSVTALEDALPLADVLELARKQQRRLEAAAR